MSLNPPLVLGQSRNSLAPLRSSPLGCTMDRTVQNLAIQYLACLQALAYGLRDVIECVEQSGHPTIQEICLTGGLSRSDLYAQQVADICQRVVMILEDDDSDAMLRGAALTGGLVEILHYPPLSSTKTFRLVRPSCRTFRVFEGCAAWINTSESSSSVSLYDAYDVNDPVIEQICANAVSAAGRRMLGTLKITDPCRDPSITSFHQRKYEVFRKMQTLEKECRLIMRQR